jgi:phosphate transport system substrate-binding protein
MMKFSLSGVLLSAGLFLTLQGCGHSANTEKTAHFTSDSSSMVVDESLQPIVDEELFIFKAQNPKVHPKVSYAPENTAVNALLEDSTRVILISRDLTPAEYKTLGERNIKPRVTRFAIDAIALIVNKTSNDTTMTLSQIKKMLNGDVVTGKNLIFDNPNSGLVRYLKALSGNTSLVQKNIFSLKSNKEVIRYVAQHPNAIGITGFGWLNDPAKDYAGAVDSVKIVGVKNDIDPKQPNEYFTPSQTTLALKQYPLTRNLYIINGAGSMSLGMEFDVFVRSDQGQRIIGVSGLLPDNIPDRQVEIVK